MVENASNFFFYRDPERPFDTERPRNWGSFGAELNGLKPWRRGGSQTSFTASESDVRHSEGVRGGPLQGDFWS